MKKIPATIAVILLTTSIALAGGPSNGADKISYFSLQSFYDNFGETQVLHWQSLPELDKAVFIKDGITFTAYFSRQGELIGTTHDIDYATLPTNARKEIEKNYPNNAVEQVFDFDDNEESDALLSFAGSEFDNQDNYFVILNDNNNEHVILEVSLEGEVSFFKKTK